MQHASRLNNASGCRIGKRSDVRNVNVLFTIISVNEAEPDGPLKREMFGSLILFAVAWPSGMLDKVYDCEDVQIEHSENINQTQFPIMYLSVQRSSWKLITSG